MYVYEYGVYLYTVYMYVCMYVYEYGVYLYTVYTSDCCYMDSWPKNESSVINYSPSCRSKPIRPSFIFGTQIKIFFMKSESFIINKTISV